MLAYIISVYEGLSRFMMDNKNMITKMAVGYVLLFSLVDAQGADVSAGYSAEGASHDSDNSSYRTS